MIDEMINDKSNPAISKMWSAFFEIDRDIFVNSRLIKCGLFLSNYVYYYYEYFSYIQGNEDKG